MTARSPRSSASPRSSSSDEVLDHALVATAAYGACRGETTPRPLFLSRVSAGFPSPADDYVETSLDVNEYLIDDAASTFFVRVSGTSMTDAGIHDDDVLVVDRSVEPSDGSIIVAALDGELTVKRYRVHEGRPHLVPESDRHAPIPIRDGQELVVWGVVRHVIHEVA